MAACRAARAWPFAANGARSVPALWFGSVASRSTPPAWITWLRQTGGRRERASHVAPRNTAASTCEQ
eukprot:8611573-Pyramimonas_sp.AAC.1